MARRARVHSRDVQLQIAAPKAKFAAARVQRLDFPWTANVTNIDELGRKLHVGTTTDIPDVNVTFEAFDVSHDTFAYLTGYTPATFPASGVSITELKNVDLIGQIRDTSSTNIVEAIYVKRGIVTGIDATFGVRDNSTVSYTVGANSKKEFRQPVFYESFTASGTQATFTLARTPTYLTRTSGYIINGYVTTATTNGGAYLTAGTDYTYDTGTTKITLTTPATVNDIYWFTYSSAVTNQTFDALDDAAPAAIQGKYVPVSISVSSIPRVQSATIRASMQAETILEMGGLGVPVGYEIGVPDVTGDISVLKTDDDLLAILEGVSNSTIENDMEYALTTLPLKIQLKDPRNPNRVQLTYYVPSITIQSEGDESTVNQSMNETFSWSSTTGELYIASGAGPW